MEKSPLIKPFFTAFLTTSKIFLESSKDGPITPYRLDLVCLTGAGFCYLKKKIQPKPHNNTTQTFREMPC